jgi:hypothetical protein
MFPKFKLELLSERPAGLGVERVAAFPPPQEAALIAAATARTRIDQLHFKGAPKLI